METHFTYYSDYGVVLMKAGYVREGLNVMRYLINLKPNEYNIIANLATAYELNGINDSALYWINKGLQINPDSHAGSEWIHKRILQAKLNIKENPAWLANNRIFSSGDMRSANQRTGIWQFSYQLQERIPFTATPDPLMSKVLEEFGDFLMQYYSVSEAWKVFSAARVYDPSRATSLDPKIIKARQMTLSNRKRVPRKTSVRHWPTDENIATLTASFEQHRFVRINDIVPKLYHH
ncbi:MAG: hypothetical protein WCF67_07675 [Chitinophagaceae bacterium]